MSTGDAGDAGDDCWDIINQVSTDLLFWWHDEQIEAQCIVTESLFLLRRPSGIFFHDAMIERWRKTGGLWSSRRDHCWANPLVALCAKRLLDATPLKADEFDPSQWRHCGQRIDTGDVGPEAPTDQRHSGGPRRVWHCLRLISFLICRTKHLVENSSLVALM